MDVLSQGIIPALVRGETPSGPHLQILQLRKIPGTGQERYRLLVNDGKYTSSFAMLATQLNDKVLSKEIDCNCIIRLDRFICNTVHQNKKVLIILDLTLIKSSSEVSGPLGNPTQYDPNKPPAEEPSKPPPSAAPQPRPPVRTPLAQRNLPNTGGFGSPGGKSNAQPISSLTPYSNRWTICARVTSKTDIRKWSNSRGEGQLFSMDLLDESGEIRATAFKDQCEMFYPMIEVDKVYYISGATLKTANKQYTSIKNDYELTFNQNTTVTPCNEETSIPTLQFDFVSIDQLESLQKDAIIDVIGICTETADISSVTIRSSGREVKKRDIQIVDQTGCSVQLTLWGGQAESFDGSTQPVIAVKGAKLSDFNGRTLSSISSSTLQINPDIPQAHKVKGWFESEGASQNIVNLSNQRGGGNTGVGSGPLKTFAEAKFENLGCNEGQPDYYSQKAAVLLVKKDNCVYTACPADGCNKKVVDMNNGLYRCEKCNKEYDSYKYRMMLQASVGDLTDNLWVTMFQDSGETLMSVTSEELGSYKDNDEMAFSNVFQNVTFKEFIFKFRVKMETYNDESRLKTSVVAVTPLDPKEYNKKLLEEIKEMAQV